MARTAQEIVEGVLGRIPDTAPEKGVLKDRFDAIMKTSTIPNLSCAAPEVIQAEDIHRIVGICQACQGVLGDPSGTDWKEEVVAYLLRADN